MHEFLIQILSENVRFWRCWTLPNASYTSISVVFADYDKIENFIQDAERHRRTPRLSAISGKMVDVWAAGFLRAVADSMRDAGRNWRRCHYSTIKFRNRKIKAIWLETILQNGWLNHSNIMPKPSKYHCRRRATPPHPRDTGHLKQGDGKREIGRLPRHRRKKMHQKWAKGNQKGANGPKMAPKIRPRAVCGPPQGRVGIRSQSACNLPACTLSPQ